MKKLLYAIAPVLIATCTVLIGLPFIAAQAVVSAKMKSKPTQNEK